MNFANSYLRALLLSLVSVGLIVPAWATQPCRCQVDGDCCQRSAAGKSCCSEKPCCARHASPAIELPTCSVGCPCCTEAPAPTTPASQQSEATQTEHSSAAVAAELPAIIPSDVSTAYLVREWESPPGHPALRLHALYRVWLN